MTGDTSAGHTDEGSRFGTRNTSGETKPRPEHGSRGATPAARRARGQTTLDFATGMSVFLIILIAVLLFIPGSLEPFTKGAQDNIVVSNRIGDELSEGLLGNPGQPQIANTTCTIAFFENRTPPGGGCQFTGQTLQERIGVRDWQYVNVTLQANRSANGGAEDILCWDDNGTSPGRIVEQSNASRNPSKHCDTRFAIGRNPPNRADATVTARRVITINESAASDRKTAVALIVEVW
ncbi:MAG: hypothetical protein ABEI77_01155 [Halorientalis sp.]